MTQANTFTGVVMYIKNLLAPSGIFLTFLDVATPLIPLSGNRLVL